jgi:hypothetical protein
MTTLEHRPAVAYPSTMDIFPVTVRGPIPTGSVRFARLFSRDGKLYLAEGQNRGRTVSRVIAYDLPEGEPTRIGNQTRWGAWTWSSCGCGSSWGSHTQEGLISLAESVQA